MSNLRKRVIKLAHDKPELRPQLLPILKEAGAYGSVRDHLTHMKSNYQTEVRDEVVKLVKADGYRVDAQQTLNTFLLGSPSGEGIGTRLIFLLDIFPQTKMKVMLEQDRKFVETLETRDIADFTPKETAQWIWKKIPWKYKQ